MLSDSQESDLLDTALLDQLRNDLGNHNISTIDLMLADDILESEDKKCDLNLMYLKENGHCEQQYHLQGMNPIPSRDEFPGSYDFQLLLNNQTPTRNWVYSQNLSKVFINMDEVLPLRFKWNPTVDGLFLRTRMVFSLEEHRSDPVIRCHNHMAMPSKANNASDSSILKHVVRCVDRQSRYEELPGGHLSISTPLGTPEVGSAYVPVHLKFLCKNSCTSGMNRRATELIFTLEDEHQNVLGRRRLQVRICSCPKRDKDKEESELTGVQRSSSGKKRKSDKIEMMNSVTVTGIKKLHSFPAGIDNNNIDSTVYNVNLEIVGKEEAMAVRKFAYDIMAGKAVRTGLLEFYKTYMNKIFPTLQ